MQLVAYGVSDAWFGSASLAVPYNARKGDVLNPLEGRVARHAREASIPTKEQWRAEIANKLKVFTDVEPYDPGCPQHEGTHGSVRVG